MLTTKYFLSALIPGEAEKWKTPSNQPFDQNREDLADKILKERNSFYMGCALTAVTVFHTIISAQDNTVEPYYTFLHACTIPMVGSLVYKSAKKLSAAVIPFRQAYP